jgi:hypothetical protein
LRRCDGFEPYVFPRWYCGDSSSEYAVAHPVKNWSKIFGSWGPIRATAPSLAGTSAVEIPSEVKGCRREQESRPQMGSKYKIKPNTQITNELVSD